MQASGLLREGGTWSGEVGAELHPRLPPVRFEPVLFNLDSSLRRRFSPLSPSPESGDGFWCVVFSLRSNEDILRCKQETQATATELNKKVFLGHCAYWVREHGERLHTLVSDIHCVGTCSANAWLELTSLSLLSSPVVATCRS